ncbi:MAG TPA: glucose-6-phosphate dehydrogenase assembly protein OpcA [Candidatus Dormibacteraeota bacterium]|nr:glucose-6-phosphate dehydrogenase assembly protein OpcA [Candidatus Dormibacteraeota bacterium]
MTAPTSQQHWRGAGVSIDEVLSQLSRLRAQAARAELGDQEHIHPRNSVLDVIVVASEAEEAERAAAVVEELAIHHPCRSVVVLDEPGRGPSRIDATVTSLTHPLVLGAACQYEQVFLRVRGSAANHISSLVDALLLPDVITYVWWTGAPPVDSDRFRSTLESADVVLVDSAHFSRPYETLTAYAELARREPAVAFGDFQWARLAPWREVVAQFFNPGERTGFLAGVGALGIDYVSSGRGNRAAASLLTGWAASALGWTLKRSATGRGGMVAAHYRSRAGHPVEVTMRPVELDGFMPGEITGVRVDAVHQGRTCFVNALRDGADSKHVLVDAEIAGRRVPRLVVPIPPRADTLLLSRLLIEARGDRVFPAALQAGVEVLRSAQE